MHTCWAGRRAALLLRVVAALLVMVGCGAPTATTDRTSTAESQADAGGEPRRLRLATTTSTADSGLLAAILPNFERRYNARVEVVAVGTGQALKLGENGDADVVLVHARAREDEFVAQGFGVNRRDVMYNDFVLVGPRNDAAGIKDLTSATEALRTIADHGATFLSRGDESGTHTKELSLWKTAGITPTAELSWYKSLGQGMGETLLAAHEQQGYTLSDRGTFLSMRSRLPDLMILVGGAKIDDNPDRTLFNPYGVIPVNPARHPSTAADLAEEFAAWMVMPETQDAIGAFGVEAYGQPLFNPADADS